MLSWAAPGPPLPRACALPPPGSLPGGPRGDQEAPVVTCRPSPGSPAPSLRPGPVCDHQEARGSGRCLPLQRWPREGVTGAPGDPSISFSISLHLCAPLCNIWDSLRSGDLILCAIPGDAPQKQSRENIGRESGGLCWAREPQVPMHSALWPREGQRRAESHTAETQSRPGVSRSPDWL